MIADAFILKTLELPPFGSIKPQHCGAANPLDGCECEFSISSESRQTKAIVFVHNTRIQVTMEVWS